jgi:hypothetical protein
MNKFYSCWYFILVLLVLSSCGSVYYNRDGTRMARQIIPVKDRYPIDSVQFKLFRFNIDRVEKEVYTPGIRYLLAQDVINYAKFIKKDLLVIIYNPFCNASDEFNLALYAENEGIPYMLVSSTNDTNMIHKWFAQAQPTKTHKYIIPSGVGFPREVLQKYNRFVAAICDSCRKEYRDELRYVKYLIIKKNDRVVLGFASWELNTFVGIKRWLDSHIEIAN